MTDFFFGCFVGFILGGLAVGLGLLLFFLTPQSKEVIGVSLKNNLPADEFVPVEWLHFQMELSPKDMPVLRQVLELYIQEGIIETLTERGKLPKYRLKIDMTA